MITRRITCMFFFLIVLTGCMYPEEELAQNQISNDTQLQVVQHAVDQYVERKNGFIPIVTKDNDTPIYLKYVIDFNLLKSESLIQSIPPTAFEAGGTYQYILIDVEENPTVKVVDLKVADQMRQVQQNLNIYISEHTYPPFGEKVTESIYTLNHEALRLDKPPFVISPYSGKNLPILIQTNGELIIDYRMDLYQFMNEYEHTYVAEDDLRKLITDNHPIAPAYSIPYTIIDGEPQFVENLNEK